jgi:hypothetical protein
MRPSTNPKPPDEPHNSKNEDGEGRSRFFIFVTKKLIRAAYIDLTTANWGRVERRQNEKTLVAE